MSGAKSGTEIFMYLESDKGKVDGECTVELQRKDDPANPLLDGFTPKKMFELSRFTFGVDAKDEPSLDDLHKKKGPDGTPLMTKEHADFIMGIAKNQTKDKPKREVPEPDPISFTRLMDKASPQLLQHVTDGTFFEKVVILKRKQAGGSAAGKPFLRLDFKGCLLTEASLSNEDPIEESYTMQVRYIFLQYCPQLPDGSLGAPVTTEWDMFKKDANE